MSRTTTYDIDTSYFSSIDSSDKAYWLGALAADGCIYHMQNKWMFQFIIAEKDRQWLQAFQNAIHSTHPLRILPGGFGTPCVRLVIVNQLFCKPLVEIGLKSGDVINRIPENLWCHFIRGLFDGDGCIRLDIGKQRHTGYIPRTLAWSLLSQSHDLLQSIQSVIAKYCDLTPQHMRFHHNVWEWTVRGNQQVKRIAQYLYPDGIYPLLARKRDTFVV
jgi:LAGLIDADG-like domain